ncbi:YraN family protein [Candidatus Uhrbacteria bacterium]|nr:YraN family protein [Candidatus Uhrbacteria bacterium]
MPHSRSRFGTLAEHYAAVYLASQGYRVLEHNVRTPVGELDLVARRGREIVFVEVKARKSHAYGTPEESVNLVKQRHLIRSSQAYIAAHRELRGLPYRIDVIAITWRGDAEPEVVHIPNAVGEI